MTWECYQLTIRLLAKSVNSSTEESNLTIACTFQTTRHFIETTARRGKDKDIAVLEPHQTKSLTGFLIANLRLGSYEGNFQRC